MGEKTLSESVQLIEEEGLLVARIHFPEGVALSEGKFFGIKVERKRIKEEGGIHYEVSAFGKRSKKDITHRERIYEPQPNASELESRRAFWTLVSQYKNHYLFPS